MKMVKQTTKKMARVSVCDVSGATSPSCTVMRAIRNVHDQPQSIRTRPAVENLSLLRPVEFKTIPQPQILDAWHQYTRYRPRRRYLRFFGHFQLSV